MRRVIIVLCGVVLLGCSTKKHVFKKDSIRKEFVRDIADAFYGGDTTKVKNINIQ